MEVIKMESEWLPIGSVVVLKGGNKPLMIYGRKQFNSRTGHEFDYVACFILRKLFG